MEICAGCNCSIEDKYLLKIRAESWHEHCVTCSVCGCHLQESCFVRDNELYCRYDYAKKFGTRCSCCGQPIGSKELVMRANQHAYHVTCFACIACGLPLRKGDQFVVRDGRLFCRFDYERELAATLQLQQEHLQQQQQPQQPEQPSVQQQAAPPRSPRSDDLDELDDSDSEQGGRGGAKRPRTILSTGQRRKFKSAFEVNPKPSRKVRESLAAETGLSVRVVQVWFQNQRAKVKKLARRQTAAAAAASVAAATAAAGGMSDATGDSPTTADSCTAAAHSIVMGDDALSIGPLDITVSGEVMLHHHGNGNNNNNNSSSINHNHSGSSSLSMLDSLTKSEDPMDKLYSMQTAYFT